MNDLKLAWERSPRSGLWKAKAGGLTLFAWDLGPKYFNWWFEATPPPDPSSMPERPTALRSGQEEDFAKAKAAVETAAYVWLKEVAAAFRGTILPQADTLQAIYALDDQVKKLELYADEAMTASGRDEYIAMASEAKALSERLKAS